MTEDFQSLQIAM